MKKKLLMIFPPLVMPTSPPLGIALLKGFLDREAPEWDVELLDLNQWTMRHLLAQLASGAITLTPAARQRIGGDERVLLEASRMMSGLDDPCFYRNPIAYDALGDAMLRFIELMVAMLHAECDHWERHQQMGPMLKALAEEVDARAPDVVGISMIFSEQLPVGAALGRHQRMARGRQVFMGGSCFTEGVENFLRWYPEAADAIVSGDGEGALKQLLSNGGDATFVPGAASLRNGRVHRNAPVYQKDIDQFAIPSFEGIPLHDYLSPEPVVPLLLSRGCYWRKCTFCVHYFSAGDTYRMHSLDRVIEMLRGFVAQGIRHFSFVDEMIAPGHFVQLARAIREANLDIAYYALSKPNKTFTPAVLRDMAASGCKYILWGVESGCQRVLDLMGKGTKKEDIATVLRNAHAAGIANHVYIICGFPTETHEEWRETMAFLQDNRDAIYAVHRSVFSLEQGSPISKDFAKFGITETWVRRETPLGARLGYRCESGVTMEEATANFQAALPFFRSFHPYARLMASYRDHALLVYSNGPGLLPQRRRFPPLMTPASAAMEELPT